MTSPAVAATPDLGSQVRGRPGTTDMHTCNPLVSAIQAGDQLPVTGSSAKRDRETIRRVPVRDPANPDMSVET